MLKVVLFIASALPLLLFLKSLVFRGKGGGRARASEFNRHVGLLSAGIVIVLGLSLLYFIVRTVLGK